MKTIQAEHAEWVNANFPAQPKDLPAAGCVEEAGELLHALIVKYRIARWGADRRYSLDRLDADVIDAIGDCCIYGVSFCNAANWDFYKLYASCQIHAKSGREHVSSGVMLVAEAVRFYELQTKEAFRNYLTLLHVICNDCGYNFEQCVETTWAKVKERRR